MGVGLVLGWLLCVRERGKRGGSEDGEMKGECVMS